MPAASKIRNRTKKCPFCAETIQLEAIKCRFCGEFIDPRIPWTNARPAVNIQPDAPALPDKPDLQDDDGVLYWGRPSALALARTLLACAMLLFAAFVMVFYPTENLFKPSPDLTARSIAAISTWTEKTGLSIACATLVFLILRIAFLKSISYEVSADRIEWARGIFSRKIDNLDLFRIVDLKLHRSIADCIFGIGTVTLVTKDASDPKFEFFKIRSPKYLYDLLKKATLESDRKQGVIHIE